MNIFLTLAYLFFIGSTFGWLLELLFRRFISHANPERKWINPGFCIGPYLPIYGTGLCFLYLIAKLEGLHIIEKESFNRIMLFLCMAVAMTLIEYIAGLVSLKLTNVRLWDYSSQWGNIQGIICPKFSLIWAAIGAGYYFFIHPRILMALQWLADNLAFSFIIGMFFGIFIIDVVHSSQLIIKIKKFADDNNVIIRYENLKAEFRSIKDKASQKSVFLFPLRSEKPLVEHMKEMLDSFEKKAGIHR